MVHNLFLCELTLYILKSNFYTFLFFNLLILHKLQTVHYINTRSTIGGLKFLPYLKLPCINTCIFIFSWYSYFNMACFTTILITNSLKKNFFKKRQLFIIKKLFWYYCIVQPFMEVRSSENKTRKVKRTVINNKKKKIKVNKYRASNLLIRTTTKRLLFLHFC